MTDLPLLNVRWWHCPDCDERAKEIDAPAGAPAPTHPCWRWGGLDVHFCPVANDTDNAVGEIRGQKSEADGSVVAIQTHHDDIYDVAVIGKPLGQ